MSTKRHETFKKKNQFEMKNILEGIKSSLDVVVYQMSNLEDKVAENTLSEQHIKKNSLRDPWYNIKHSNICIIRISGEKRAKDGNFF